MRVLVALAIAANLTNAAPAQYYCRDPTIMMVTQPGCVYCDLAKAFFAQHGIGYIEIDHSSPRAQPYWNLGTPIFFIGESGQMVRGFSPALIARYVCPRRW